MKKTYLLLLLVIFIFGLNIPLAKASWIPLVDDIKISDLGVDYAGVLPSSPFYFMKEWKRDIKRTFTVNPIKKAELALFEINERAAEIKKLEEITPQNIAVISRALTNYEDNLNNLELRLKEIKETSQNSNVDKLLDTILERSIQHRQIIEIIQEQFPGDENIQNQIIGIKEKINVIILIIPSQFESNETFEQRLARISEKFQDSINKEIGIINLLEKLKIKLSENNQIKIEELKNKFIGNIENEIMELELASGTSAIDPKIIRSIKVKIGIEEDNNKCIQVITPAISPEGECKEFSTPCDRPADWKKVDQCPVKTE